MAQPWQSFYDKGVPSTIVYPRIPLFQVLDDMARKYANCVAAKLILRYLGPLTLGGELTYAQLLTEVNRFAAALHSLGVRRGDRVAIMAPNLPQFVISFYGAARLGAIVVNTNPTYTSREMEHQFADAGAETVVLLSPYYRKLKEIQAHTAIKRAIVADVTEYATGLTNVLAERKLRHQGLLVDVQEDEGVYHFRKLLAAHPEAPPVVAVDPDEIALFQYTGGTTGVPKAAMLSHYNLVTNTVQVNRWLTSLEEGKERVMGAIPFFHVYGMTVAMSLSIYCGGTLLIVPNPRPIDGVMKAIHNEKATVFPGVPAMYIGIINHPDVSQYDLRSVKACISGSAPLPMEVQVKFGGITGGRLVEGYGLTEAAPVTQSNPIYGTRKAGAIGDPFPDVAAKIMDYDKLIEKPQGEEGELWVAGPQVMKGYWNKPDETAKTITEDGWLRTGDIARMDEDGYFYIVDRLKDLIIASGYKVIPREVEEVLFQNPKVQEAVVAGVPDAYRGETVKAFVVLKAGETATTDELTKWCAERLAPYKVPKQIEFRSELPKTMVGKVLRRVLVEEEQSKQAKS